MTIKTLGMGIAKLLTKKRKVLTADKGAMRIEEINKKIRNAHHHVRQDLSEDHAQEVLDIYNKGKK